MARISRVPLEEETYKQILDALDLILGKLKKEEVRSFLFSLLGKNERVMLSKRFAAILLLNEGMNISQVSQKLKLTRQTIIRLSMTKQIKNEGFELAIKKINKDRMAREINKLLLGLAKTSAEVFLTHRIKPSNDSPNR